MSPVIELKNLNKSFQNAFSLHIPKLEITKGCLTGFVGNNGAGKTTLFKLITDLILPDSGEVLIKGKNARFNEDWKFFTACYLDESFLMDYLTPMEYFHFLSNLKGLKPDELQATLKEFESFLPLKTFVQRKLIRNYSKGNIQKIGIVSCFLLNPEIVILDEPFSNLDPSAKLILQELLIEMKTKGLTIIISSHDIESVYQICDRVLLLDQGSITIDSKFDTDVESKIDKHFKIASSM